MKLPTTSFATAAVAATLATALLPAAAQANGLDDGNPGLVTIYFTRHAEKKTTQTLRATNITNYSLSYDGDGATATRERGRSDGDRYDEVCLGTDDDCAEELNAFGLARADLLVEYFDRRGQLDDIDAVYSSHKYRTYQTVLPAATALGLPVTQLPADETELSAGAGASECPTLDAIRSAPGGSTLLIAGHSGTLYDIMGDGNDDCAGLGLLADADASSAQFPKKSNGKVRDYGDIWTVVLRPSGEAVLRNRVQLDVVKLLQTDYVQGD